MRPSKRIPFIKYMMIHYDIFVIGMVMWMAIEIFIDNLNLLTAIWVSTLYTIAWSLIILLFFYLSGKPLKKLF